jgi:hypothetical protein
MMTVTITEICSEIQPLLREKLFHPTFTSKPQLDNAIARFVNACSTSPADDPVRRINAALPELEVTNTAFWGDGERPLGALSALNATLSMFLDDEREIWVFNNVVPGGVAAKAGIVPGDILVAINDKPVTKSPSFLAGQFYVVTIVDRPNQTKEIPLSDGRVVASNCPPMAPPPPAITSSIVRPGVGLIRISGFPGIIGFDFAHQLVRLFANFSRITVPGSSSTCARIMVAVSVRFG